MNTIGNNTDYLPVIAKEAKHLRRSSFIEANTENVTIDHLINDCVVPVFSKDNEITISHSSFIEAIVDAARSYFRSEYIEAPEIRVSHIIKGRIPEAIYKPVNQLLESDKTIYYERMAFVFEIPGIYKYVDGNKLTLSIGGVRSYNLENLYSRKGFEKFKIFIGFKNLVCCNLCVSSDGYISELKVTDSRDLYKSALELFNSYNIDAHINLLSQLKEQYLSENQFCQIIGRMRLYQNLPQSRQRQIPRMLMTDSQINQVAKSYINDYNFKGSNSQISVWKFYNLLTGANKSSYIDSFLDRSLNAIEISKGINQALKGDDLYSWFLK